mgnify:CR=1 FL=1
MSTFVVDNPTFQTDSLTNIKIFFNSFKLKETWVLGVLALLLVMAAAFMGYVLP